MALESATNIPEVKDVIVKIRELSADEKVREEAFYREMRLHDEATAINSSRREGLRKGLDKGRREGRTEGIMEIAKNMIIGNMPFDKIAEFTKLDVSEIKSLASSLSSN